MSTASVKIALETALKAGIGSMQVGWENAEFEPPTDGSAFVMANMLPANPENPTMGDAFHREIGLFQVTLSYPLGSGAGKTFAKAEVVRALFPRGTTFTAGGVTTTIARTPAIGPGMKQGDRYVLPVRIPYFANVFT